MCSDADIRYAFPYPLHTRIQTHLPTGIQIASRANFASETMWMSCSACLYVWRRFDKSAHSNDVCNDGYIRASLCVFRVACLASMLRCECLRMCCLFAVDVVVSRTYISEHRELLFFTLKINCFPLFIRPVIFQTFKIRVYTSKAPY